MVLKTDFSGKKLLFAPWAAKNKQYFSYQAWYSALSSLFDSTIVFDPQKELYKHGKDKMNAKFLELISKEKPDFIFLWLIYDEFYLETLDQIKEVSPKTRLVNFFGDDNILFDRYSKYMSLFVDYSLASHHDFLYKYKENNISPMFFSCGVNTNQFKELSSEKEIDVTFVGTPMADRVDYISYLIKKGVKVKVFGTGWEKYKEFSNIFGGKLSSEEMVEVINKSKINLSFSKNYAGVPGFKSRVFEVSACNSFILVEKFDGYNKFLKPGKELVMFDGKEDLLKKINYYLKNEKERESIANRAYNKIISNYSQVKEFENIFSQIIKLNNPKKVLPFIETGSKNLSILDLQRDRKDLTLALKDFEFVTIGNPENKHFRYYMQKYSLDKTGKDISCCDYYIKSNSIGDYISIFTEHSQKTMKRPVFLKTIPIECIMVRKSYFLDNLELFRSFDESKDKLLRDNVCFVGIPLLSIKSKPKINDEDLDKISLPLFENLLRVVKNNKYPLLNPHLYKLGLYGLIFDRYIVRRLIKQERYNLFFNSAK